MTPAGSRGRRFAVLAAGLGLSLSLGLSGCGDSGDDEAALRDQIRTLQAEKQANEDAVTAAKAFVVKVTTYSYKPGEHDFAWVEEFSNEQFRERYRGQVVRLKKAIETSKTSAKGQVVEAMGRVVDETQVEVLVFLDQAITDPSGEVSVEESTVMLPMRLDEESGTWKPDTLEFLNKVGS